MQSVLRNQVETYICNALRP